MCSVYQLIRIDLAALRNILNWLFDWTKNVKAQYPYSKQFTFYKYDIPRAYSSCSCSCCCCCCCWCSSSSSLMWWWCLCMLWELHRGLPFFNGSLCNYDIQTCLPAVVHGPGLELCMGMGTTIPMGFPWDFHKNGSSFGLLMGMGIAYFIKFPPEVWTACCFCTVTCSDSLINVNSEQW